jgi:CDP-glucose 4,6-dehydratase
VPYRVDNESHRVYSASCGVDNELHRVYSAPCRVDNASYRVYSVPCRVDNALCRTDIYIIPDCVRAVCAGREILVRNPDSTRPYQHVLECLYGYLLLAERQYTDKSFVGAYNFGPDEESCVKTGELVALFCTAWGVGAEWRVQRDGGPHEANFLKLDCTKAKTVLGWHPRWTIKTAVEKTVEFAKLDTDVERSACLERQIKEYFV